VFAAKLRMFHKSLLVHQIQKILLGHEIVFLAMLLVAARLTRRVGDAEAEFVGVLFEETGEDG
jgi:hypothetical protein